MEQRWTGVVWKTGANDSHDFSGKIKYKYKNRHTHTHREITENIIL